MNNLSTIQVYGIRTNNLKNLDISLSKNEINLVIGSSGSGKSSLAYDTIAQIGQHEYMSMFADNCSEPCYKVEKYNNIPVAVPIKQFNHNNNTRSTIGTYFGLSKNIALIYSILLGVEESFFVLNKENNVCSKCHGLGTKKHLDINKIIDFDVPLNKNPILCWNKYKSFYADMISLYCKQENIDANKTFIELNENEKKSFLYGESHNKFSIKYKKTNRMSQRTTKFYGIMTGVPMMPNFSPATRFYSDVICESCKGKKYSKEHEKYKIFGIAIGDFMTMSFEKLLPFLKKIQKTNTQQGISFFIETLIAFIEKANELYLGHLFFNRAIPTLSGGELQRLRMVQVLNTQLADLLIVLDEPLAGLSGIEKKSIFNNVVNLSKKHTVLVVDHGKTFCSVAQNIIAVGPTGGSKGGYIIDAKKYLAEQDKKFNFQKVQSNDFYDVELKYDVYGYKGTKIQIEKNSLNLITGRSGVGKSTLLREYLPQFFKGYKYISQKALLGNKNSSVATVLDIAGSIFTVFAKKFHTDKYAFSNSSGSDGCCTICNGAGYLEYENGDNTTIKIECGECSGFGFNKKLKDFTIQDKNIFDIWNMTIEDGIDFFEKQDKKIANKMKHAVDISIGYLKIGQAVSTLSGGENIRIKILKSVHSRSQVLGIDEPFKGLNNSEIFSVVKYLDKLRAKEKTIVVVDHTSGLDDYFANKIELTERNSMLVARK